METLRLWKPSAVEVTRLKSSFCISFCGLQETRLDSLPSDIGDWSGDRNLGMEFVPSVGKSGGMISFWDKSLFQDIAVIKSRFFLAVVGYWKRLVGETILVNIYAPQVNSEKKLHWRKLRDLINSRRGLGIHPKRDNSQILKLFFLLLTNFRTAQVPMKKMDLKGVVGLVFGNENSSSNEDSYVERLLDCISNGQLADDRRNAMAELQSVVAESHAAQLAFGEMGFPVLLGVLRDRDDVEMVIRNEALLLLTYLTREAEEIQKILVFEGAFEKIFSIIKEEGGSEGGVVVQDCLELLNNLLRNNASNQVLLRETIGFDSIISILKLRGTTYSFTQQKTINLLSGLETISLLLSGGLETDPTTNNNRITNKTVLVQVIDIVFMRRSRMSLGWNVKNLKPKNKKVPRSAAFNKFSQEAGLNDLHMGGRKFTLFSDDGYKLSKLDRFLVCSNIVDAFPSASVVALPREYSDHSPIVFRTSLQDFGPRPFRFYNSWLHREDCDQIVNESWGNFQGGGTADRYLSDKLRNLKKALRNWRRVECKKEDKDLVEMKKIVEALDQEAECRQLTNDEILKLKDGKAKIIRLEKFKKEDLLQKSKAKWIKDGDENSRFFHNSLKAKNRRITMHGLMINGEWITDPAAIKDAVFNFFGEKFKESQPSRPCFKSDGFKKLSDTDRIWLESPIDENEIKTAIWDCGNEKAPGPDGYTIKFLKNYWNLLQEDIMAFVRYFEAGGKLSRGSNSSFLSLLPKVKDPLSLNDYRPISLVGCCENN
ncbi:hypothetical protein LXL04_011938 [Taraxacum kok-saghyz]